MSAWLFYWVVSEGMMTFSDFVGHEDARLALALNAIEPRCGGVLFAGEKGSGKSTLIRLFRNVLPEKTPFVEVPLNVTEDALLGTIDIETTVKTGVKTVQIGLLTRANRGILFMDDVNLLPEEAVSLILEAGSKKENIMEREGLSERYDADFIPIAAMDPEEGVLSSHFLDRFGLCVLWESLREPSDRLRIMKQNMSSFPESPNGHAADDAFREKILSCRRVLDSVTVPADVAEYITQTCVQNIVSGHRADVFLFYATKAYAAYCGDRTAALKHVDAVAPLVLIHRQRQIREPEQDPPETNREEPNTQSPTDPADKPESGDPGRQNALEPRRKEPEDTPSAPSELRESAIKEEIFGIGDPFKIRRLIFRKDRQKRTTTGRRTRTRSKDKGGRYVRSVLKPEDDIAIDATIRAAAPYQRIRNRQNRLIIRENDVRYKQREKKTGHLVIFAVDGSGSMGAQKRMIETKAAIQSLLTDCYQKRDKVSLIVFRKDKAEVVLAPTSSVEHASKKLREIPVGGKTPLTAALIETHSLIRRVSKKSPETRFLVVVITDGRANHRLSNLSIDEEIRCAAQMIGETPADCIVVDTEEKGRFLTTDLAKNLSAYLDADYYTIDSLKSDDLIEMVKKNRMYDPQFIQPS